MEKDVLSEVQYERYRELIHNDFRAVDQKQVLSEIQVEESFEKMARKLDKKREQRAAINVQYGEKSKPKGYYFAVDKIKSFNFRRIGF